MRTLKRFVGGCRVFWRGLKILVGVKPFPSGDKKLAILSSTIRPYVQVAGVGVVRKQLLREIETDLKGQVKKNPRITADQLLSKALKTPEYMALLKDIELGETDLRFFADQALQKWGENAKS